MTFFENKKNHEGPVTCLGMTFNNDEERRAYFKEELRKKLPELRKIEGFPIGEDEDILALSDPPYYTACPNPWINDFIDEWEKEKTSKYVNEEKEYRREPFAVDISEGKNHPLYLAHRYHTKVPHRAIMSFLLHYTSPGDLVFDGFGGTGVTAVASNLCSNINEIEELGYRIIDDKIYTPSEQYIGKVGKRKSIVNDLSPLATLIENNFVHPQLLLSKKDAVYKILKEIEDEYSLIYKTKHQSNNIDNSEFGTINYTIWSEVFICPSCSSEIDFFNATVDLKNRTSNSNITCNNCNFYGTKSDFERAFETYFDSSIQKIISKVKLIPVYINYSYKNKRFDKKVDQEDLHILRRIHDSKGEFWFPTDSMPEGTESSRNSKYGYTNIHHMMPTRSKYILSIFLDKLEKHNLQQYGKILLTASIPNLTWNYSWRMNGKGGFISGTLYIPSTPQENNAINQLFRKFSDIIKGLQSIYDESKDIMGNAIVSTQSLTSFSNLKDNTVDYIFTDPPFGGNLMYSELNFMWESWLRIKTCNTQEAIVNPIQRKALPNYQSLMESCFKEYYRVLKAGRWMTVEFSNSQSSVWNAIQEAIQRAGFVIANVSALDKKQGSFKAITTTTAVKQDLIISAYKPREENIEKMRNKQNTEESAWIFVQQHLNQLPVFIGSKGEAKLIIERNSRILFDRMVAYHVQNGFPVPISSAEFQEGINQRFPMRDGMAFLESQVAEYDKKRILVKEFSQMSLFVSDENSAIEWIRQQLMNKPQTRQDLHPNYMKEIQHIAKHELLPELDQLLEQNFLIYEGNEPVPSQIHTYLSTNYKDLRGLEKEDSRLKDKAKNRWYVPDPNKQADLEKLRERSLLREFANYMEELDKSKKKLRQFRTEAIRAGFKKAWGEKDYSTIVTVGERLPESVIQEDDKLLMYFDNAQIRLGL